MVEFNTGFVTALSLFYGHLASFQDSPDLILYAATDHLYDIEYPKNISVELKAKIKGFVSMAFAYRMERPSKETVHSVFDDCKEILMEIDKEVFDLEVEANYS